MSHSGGGGGPHDYEVDGMHGRSNVETGKMEPSKCVLIERNGISFTQSSSGNTDYDFTVQYVLSFVL